MMGMEADPLAGRTVGGAEREAREGGGAASHSLEISSLATLALGDAAAGPKEAPALLCGKLQPPGWLT
jgi:hypothetical protein